jgi:hypothetical protein
MNYQLRVERFFPVFVGQSIELGQQGTILLLSSQTFFIRFHLRNSTFPLWCFQH